MLIFQPAEEGLGGARAMLAGGLFDKFPALGARALVRLLPNAAIFPVTGEFAVEIGSAATASATTRQLSMSARRAIAFRRRIARLYRAFRRRDWRL